MANSISTNEIKQAARGRWPEIIAALTDIPADALDPKRHGPCPKCGGTDRFRAVDIDNGALLCNQCFNTKNGDGIAALQWANGIDFKAAIKLLADYLGIQNGNRKPKAAKKPRVFASTKSLTADIIRRLTKEHGQGVRFIKAWAYGTFHVLRFDLPTPAGEKQRKEFRPVHQVPLGLDGCIGWQAGYPVGPRPLYRRQELEGVPAGLVTVHGGEKAADAAAALGLVATTNAGGEKAIDKTDLRPLARFDAVAIVIDNDATGESFGWNMAVKLKAQNPDQVVKIIRLPDLPPKGDVVEWVAAGGTREDFLRIVDAAPPVTSEEIEAWKKGSASKNTPSEDDDPGLIKTLADAICLIDHFARDGGGKLHHYHNGVFRPDGERHVKTTVKTLLTERGQTKKWSSRLASEVVEFIRVDAPELPDRPRMDLVNVENGMVHVEDGVLLPHDPKYLSVVQLPVKFDSAAMCPNIEKFVNSTFPGDAHNLAWEIIGVLMLPIMWLQKAILLLGEGANGKSVFLALVIRFIGKFNIATIPLHRLETDKFVTARLVGKLANVCADLPSEHLAGTSVFKAIVGGDTLPAEHKFKDSFDVTPFTRLVFSANHPPRSADSSAAFFRRWVVVPFDHTFTPAKQIPRDILDSRLQSPEELSGLLNKALEGLRRVQRQRGFSEPASVQAAWRDFHATTDPLAVWLDRYTIDDPDAFVPKQTIRVAYNAQVERDGRPAMTAKGFGQAIYKLRPNIEERQRTVGGKYQWCYIGIGLASFNTDTRNTLNARDTLLLSSRTREDENEEGSSVEKIIEANPVHPVHPVDCPHSNVAETPTHDGFANRQCRDCGAPLPCRRQEQTA